MKAMKDMDYNDVVWPCGGSCTGATKEDTYAPGTYQKKEYMIGGLPGWIIGRMYTKRLKQICPACVDWTKRPSFLGFTTGAGTNITGVNVTAFRTFPRAVFSYIAWSSGDGFWSRILGSTTGAGTNVTGI